MNMQQLMQQAQKMQKDMKTKKAEVEATTFDSVSSLVKVKMTGKKELIELKINTESLTDKEDIEMLEDMVKIAVNDCLKQIDKMTQEKLGQYSSMVDGLM